MAVDDNSNKKYNFAQNNDSYDLRSRNRQILSERFTPEELKTLSGSLEEAEALLQGRDESSVPEIKTEKTGDRELAERQETVLENWTKEKSFWIDYILMRLPSLQSIHNMSTPTFGTGL